MVVSALDAWFDRAAGAVHAFGGEVLKFIGDGFWRFPVAGAARREACDAALRRRRPPAWGWFISMRSGFGRGCRLSRRALHLGEMLWGNIGAANRLDFTAIGRR